MSIPLASRGRQRPISRSGRAEWPVGERIEEGGCRRGTAYALSSPAGRMIKIMHVLLIQKERQKTEYE